MTGSVGFETSTAPHPPLAELVSNPTQPGHITRARTTIVLRMLWAAVMSRTLSEDYFRVIKNKIGQVALTDFIERFCHFRDEQVYLLGR
jgi:hypothetical protein